MDRNDYKYEVAFSFVEPDEALATEINDLLRDRMATFVYSEHQEDLVSRDGMDLLSRVFGEESRVVVILYREEWGKTPWTGVEERAIKDRGLVNVGYDFVVLIPLGEPTSVPSWFPKSQIWFNLKRYGTNGAAAVIEARARDAGTTARVESVTERAARLSRQIDAEEGRKRFLGSSEGAEAALAEAQKLLGTVETLANQCEGFTFSVDRGDRDMEVWADRRETVVVEWCQLYRNSLTSSRLIVQLWEGTPVRHGRVFIEKPRMLSEECYNFDRAITGALGWRSTTREREFLSTQQLGEKCVDKLMDYVHKQRMA